MRAIFVIAALLLAAAPFAGPARAQDAVRTQQLEEQVRQLTGRVEELSFQLLQMEERMRKMQEDNEFRFQELEDAAEQPKKTDAAPSEGKDGLGKSEAARAAERELAAKGKGDPALKASPKAAAGPAPAAKREAPPKKGTLRFDDSGKLVAGPGMKPGRIARDKPLKAPASPFATADEAAVAAAAFGSTPDAVFARARELYRGERYGEAAKAFRAHVGAWPKDGREAEARYWLGRSLFQSGEYYDAASTLLDAHNRFPQARTAPDALLALGLSLAGLEQREVACATYAEVLNQYPEAAARLGDQVRAEQESTRC